MAPGQRQQHRYGSHPTGFSITSEDATESQSTQQAQSFLADSILKRDTISEGRRQPQRLLRK